MFPIVWIREISSGDGDRDAERIESGVWVSIEARFHLEPLITVHDTCSKLSYSVAFVFCLHWSSCEPSSQRINRGSRSMEGQIYISNIASDHVQLERRTCLVRNIRRHSPHVAEVNSYLTAGAIETACRRSVAV